MDFRHVDALARSLHKPGARRGLLALLASLPVLGGLFTLLDPDESDAKGRRKRRKKRHKHRTGKRKKNRTGKRKGKHKKQPTPDCIPDALATTCAGRCGHVTNNCQQAVDCGPCSCDPPCGDCFTCQEEPNAPGQCVVDAEQVGDPCGSEGQVCQADGACACDASTCSNPTPLCTDGSCVSCTATDECIAAGLGTLCCDGSCVSGVCCSNAACAPTGDECLGNQCTCGSEAACAGDPELCCNSACVDTDTDPDHCGACDQSCTGDTPVCWDGACVCGDVCADVCQFTSVQAAITAATTGATIVICPGAYATMAATLDKNLTLVGAGMGADPSTATILDGGQTSGVLVVNDGVTATIRALTITRGQAEWGGGIDHLGGTLDLDTVLVTGNNATIGGSGIVSVGSLTLTDSIARLNGGAFGVGGGIYTSFATSQLTLVRSVVEQNEALAGGGIQSFQGNVSLTDNSHVRNNHEDGIVNDGGIVSISGGSTITLNTPTNCVNVNGGTGCPA